MSGHFYLARTGHYYLAATLFYRIIIVMLNTVFKSQIQWQKRS